MAKKIDFKDKQEINSLTEHSALTGWPMIIGWAAMLIFAIHACTHMVAAGDTWVAMACGRHFVDHGVNTVEPFSAYSHKAGPTKDTMAAYAKLLRQEAAGEKGIKYSLMRWFAGKADNFENWPDWLKSFAKWIHPTGWINQNWLTHVIFYELVPKSTYTPSDTFTSNALVYWKFAIYILTVICVYYTARFLGVNPALAAAFTCFAIFTGRTYFDVRPAGFSNLLVAVYLLVLVLATYRNILYIWLIVPIMVFWCNVHGGYLYVFIMLVPFIALHLLALFPRKWTITCFAISMWSALYLLTQKFSAELNKMGQSLLNDSSLFNAPAVSKDSLFYLLLVLILIGIAITIPKKVSQGLLLGFHIVALVLIFLAALTRFFPEISFKFRLCPEAVKVQLLQYISNSQLFFIFAFLVMLAIGIAISFFKHNLVSLNLKSLVHTALAGVTSFILMIIFNPFHLTNLTHTFVISLSKHAEMWRAINEWHSAFEWSNPVGTSYPFLILFLLCLLIPAFWLISLLLVPKGLSNVREGPKSAKISKGDMEKQQKKFGFLLSAFGFLAAVFICWVTLISFSFINYDLSSFLICALFVVILLLSVYKSVHFIYLFIFFVPLILSLSRDNPGYAGRYIYPFILLPIYLVMCVIASLLSKKIRTRPLDIVFVSATAVFSLILMVIFYNPFRFNVAHWHYVSADNLWSSFSAWLSAAFKWLFSGISSLKYLPKVRIMWQPAYINNAKPDYTYLFPVLYVINILSVIIWLTVPYLRSFLIRISRDKEGTVRSDSQAQQYQLLKTDLGLVAIAALTIYMAVKMRRFIPIAAIAACPALAMFLDRTIRIIAASFNFYKVKRFFVSSMPQYLQTFFILSAAAVTAFLAVSWGLKFKYVYLDSWPTDDRFTSVFMRMTASDAKPFYALKFIKDNKIQGKMFNYWTEGGFIAWGQQPDPNTGRTPLQLFIDGRAQAAYEPEAYLRWSDIYYRCGPALEMAKATGTTPDYTKVGEWIDLQLTKENVWIVLIPYAEFESDFVSGIENSSNWMIIFYDNKQKLYVKKNNPESSRLFEGIFDGSTIYPSDFSKDLILSYYKLKSPDPNERKQGFDHAVKAFNEYPCQVSVQRVIYAARYGQLKPQVDQICKSYYDNFMENKAEYKKQDAYYDRIFAALFAGDYLRELSENANDTELMKIYLEQIAELKSEMELLRETNRW